jgi:uncharacterized protein (DUF305 family)
VKFALETMHVTLRNLAVATVSLALLALTPLVAAGQHDHHDHEGSSSTVPLSCDAVATPVAMGDHDHDPDSIGTPTATPGDIEFDQLYIDMMIPHHAAVISLAQVALPELSDSRLKEIAREIIRNQSSENEQLGRWRMEWYGSSVPAMDEASMNQMLEAMPVGTMDEMMLTMDAGMQVAAFCTADDPDLAFIAQAIVHHQMAIDASVIAIDTAGHPELVTFAEGVVAAQQAEIDSLNEILTDLQGA